MDDKKEKALLMLKEIEQLFPGGPKVKKAIHLLESWIKGDTQVESKEKKGAFSIPDFVVENQGYALYSDGACRGNPGPGAWAALAQNWKGEVIFELQGMELMTTNNKMELEASIKALEEVYDYFLTSKLSPPKIYVFTDSKYVVEGSNSWIKNWKSRNWKKSDNKPPENLILWKKMDELLSLFLLGVEFHWIKGHAGHPQNERCDQLANQALDESGY